MNMHDEVKQPQCVNLQCSCATVNHLLTTLVYRLIIVPGQRSFLPSGTTVNAR